MLRIVGAIQGFPPVTLARRCDCEVLVLLDGCMFFGSEKAGVLLRVWSNTFLLKGSICFRESTTEHISLIARMLS